MLYGWSLILYIKSASFLAIANDFNSHVANQILIFLNLSSHWQRITCKFILKIKLKSLGFINCFKAWLIAYGFNQVYYLDYNNFFIGCSNSIYSINTYSCHSIWPPLLSNRCQNHVFEWLSLRRNLYSYSKRGLLSLFQNGVLLPKILYRLKKNSTWMVQSH